MDNKKPELCSLPTCPTINVEFPEDAVGAKIGKSEKIIKSEKPEISKKVKASSNSALLETKEDVLKDISRESLQGDAVCMCNVFPCDEVLLPQEVKDERRLDAPTISQELLLENKSTMFLEKGFALRNVQSFVRAVDKTAQLGKAKEVTESSILKTGFGLKSVRSLQEALKAEKHIHSEKDLCKGFGLKKLASLEHLIKKEDRKQKELLHSLKDEEIRPYQDAPLKSLLKTGFGLRSADSLAQAILEDEYLKRIVEAQVQQQEEYEDEAVPIIRQPGETITASSQTSDISTEPKLRIRDYMKQISPEEELEEKEGERRQVIGRKMINVTAAMRKAQRYLKLHRIFEFFHFLIAHLISERPADPINFLLDLLNKCLLYRSGLLPPPLLYQKPHLESLFEMMDPMHTGVIDFEQYKTALKTLGICSFKKNPETTSQKTITRKTFIEEAHSCLIELLNDLIRRRWTVSSRASFPLTLPNPPPTLITIDVHLYDLPTDA